jgi:hypothetical protein
VTTACLVHPDTAALSRLSNNEGGHGVMKSKLLRAIAAEERRQETRRTA